MRNSYIIYIYIYTYRERESEAEELANSKVDIMRKAEERETMKKK